MKNQIKRYRVIEDKYDNYENFNGWYGRSGSDEIAAKQASGWTIEELEDLARGWDVEMSVLMEQVEEI